MCIMPVVACLHGIDSPDDKDGGSTRGCITVSGTIASKLKKSCLVFLQSDNSKPKQLFLLRDLVRAVQRLVGRSTLVYETFAGVVGTGLPKEITILGLSWQCSSRENEGDDIRRLHIPAWKDHLPELSFSATYSAEKLGPPWTRMTLEDPFGNRFESRRLDVITSCKHKNILKAGTSRGLIKQASID